MLNKLIVFVTGTVNEFTPSSAFQALSGYTMDAFNATIQECADACLAYDECVAFNYIFAGQPLQCETKYFVGAESAVTSMVSMAFYRGMSFYMFKNSSGDICYQFAVCVMGIMFKFSYLNYLL